MKNCMLLAWNLYTFIKTAKFLSNKENGKVPPPKMKYIKNHTLSAGIVDNVIG